MIPNIGPMEIIVVLAIALIVFGPKRLPELGSSLGKGIRGFGKGIKGEHEDEPAAIDAGQQQSELSTQQAERDPHAVR